MKWIAVAYDSDHGFAIGDTPEEAQQAYIDNIIDPDYGFSVIRNREDFSRELKRVGIAMGYVEQQSIPMWRTPEWIIVARITEDGIKSLEGKSRAAHLVNDWSREDGWFFIDLPKPKLNPLVRRYGRFKAPSNNETA